MRDCTDAELEPRTVPVYLFQDFCLMHDIGDTCLKLLKNGEWNEVGISIEVSSLRRCPWHISAGVCHPFGGASLTGCTVQSCAIRDGGWSGLLKLLDAGEPGQIFVAGVVLHIYCSQDSLTKPAHFPKVPQTVQVKHTSIVLLSRNCILV